MRLNIEAPPPEGTSPTLQGAVNTSRRGERLTHCVCSAVPDLPSSAASGRLKKRVHREDAIIPQLVPGFWFERIAASAVQGSKGAKPGRASLPGPTAPRGTNCHHPLRVANQGDTG